ncbi:MAG: glycosyltransferase family 4 protein [Phycisphaerales bacterium]|nr:glycosyltransferase family 4 protein [Phycisphaerales bacterium]
MKLLWHMPTFRSVSCGLSIRALNFARQLRRRGHEIEFAVARDKTDCVNGIIDGFPIQLLDVVRRHPVHWSLQARERLRAARDAVSQIALDCDAIITCQPEAVIALHGSRTRTSAGSIAESGNPQHSTPIFFVCGGTTLLHDNADAARARQHTFAIRNILSVPTFALDRSLKRRNERHAFERADACIFDSESTRNRVVDAHGISPDKCHALRGAVDTEVFRPPTRDERQAARLRFAIADADFAIAWTGRMSPEKNLETLIRSIPECGDRRIRLLLAGDGAERPRLEKITHCLDADCHQTTAAATTARRVQFLRDLPDVRPLLHAADAFAFPSVSESLGLSLIEAMACGLPSIALQADERRIRNASAEILDHGRCGRLVADNAARSFAAAFDLLAHNTAECARLAASARQHAITAFGWSDSADKFESLITRRICRSKGQANPVSTDPARGSADVEPLVNNAPESIRA